MASLAGRRSHTATSVAGPDRAETVRSHRMPPAGWPTCFCKRGRGDVRGAGVGADRGDQHRVGDDAAVPGEGVTTGEEVEQGAAQGVLGAGQVVGQVVDRHVLACEVVGEKPGLRALPGSEQALAGLRRTNQGSSRGGGPVSRGLDRSVARNADRIARCVDQFAKLVEFLGVDTSGPRHQAVRAALRSGHTAPTRKRRRPRPARCCPVRTRRSGRAGPTAPAPDSASTPSASPRSWPSPPPGPSPTPPSWPWQNSPCCSSPTPVVSKKKPAF